MVSLRRRGERGGRCRGRLRPVVPACVGPARLAGEAEDRPVAPVDAAAFRRAAGRFPTGIVVVATSLEGNGHAMTVSAFTSVSLDPLLVLFCAEKVARFHDAVLKAGIWSVSVLDEESEKT